MSTTNLVANDEYYTPPDAWTDIARYIPRDKTIWEPFNTTADPRSLESSEHLRTLGFDVVAAPYDPETGANDFFASDHGDIVVSNPPFTRKRDVLKRLRELGKPFILILPVPTMNTGYFREMFLQDEHLGIIIPRKRINFRNKRNASSNCFECYYYCWRIDGVTGINWIT